MKKYKILGVVLMLSIMLSIYTSFQLDTLSIQYAISGTMEFLSVLSLLTITLFGSLTALTLDK